MGQWPVWPNGSGSGDQEAGGFEIELPVTLVVLVFLGMTSNGRPV